MATAKNYTISFVGGSGRTYQVSGYTADTAGSANTFNPSGQAGTGSLQYWRCPENVVMTDFSIPTGTTQVSGYLTENGAVRNGTIVDYVSCVSTNPSRPRFNIPFTAGTLIGAVTI